MSELKNLGIISDDNSSELRFFQYHPFDVTFTVKTGKDKFRGVTKSFDTIGDALKYFAEIRKTPGLDYACLAFWPDNKQEVNDE